ncbi:MAG: hypothetical protein Q8P18_22690 [Pseudomonadota bacterium]|nr:hypothetical protein [Pseudomonadota bacterium]
MQAEPWAARADRHSRLRWVGVVLFFGAAIVLAGGVAALVTGQPGPRLLPWCVLAVGLSLGSFGTNDDTTLHALAQLGREGTVPAHHKAEWEHERKVRGARLSTLHAHPKAAWILPLFATGALLFAGWRVGAAWGFIS